FAELDTALTTYHRGLEIDPDHVGLLVAQVHVCLEKHREDQRERTTAYWQAREAYNRAAAILKEQSRASPGTKVSIQLGELYLAMEEYSLAERPLLSATRAEPRP